MKPKPKHPRWIGREDDFQIAVAKLMDCHSRHWFHIAGERKTTPRAGAKLKAKGQKAGCPDVMCLDRRNSFQGLAMELKVHPNKPTDLQIQWLAKLNKLGWKTAVCYSIDEVIEIVEAYFETEPTINHNVQEYGC